MVQEKNEVGKLLVGGNSNGTMGAQCGAGSMSDGTLFACTGPPAMGTDFSEFLEFPVWVVLDVGWWEGLTKSTDMVLSNFEGSLNCGGNIFAGGIVGQTDCPGGADCGTD